MQKLFALCTALLFSLTINSQNLQSPSEFLGYPIGTQFSRHHQVIDYFKQVAAERPREVKLENYAVRKRAVSVLLSAAKNSAAKSVLCPWR